MVPGSLSEAIGRPADRIKNGIAADSNTQNGLFHIHKADEQAPHNPQGRLADCPVRGRGRAPSAPAPWSRGRRPWGTGPRPSLTGRAGRCQDP